jgi:hypothetical protein
MLKRSKDWQHVRIRVSKEDYDALTDAKEHHRLSMQTIVVGLIRRWARNHRKNRTSAKRTV